MKAKPITITKDVMRTIEELSEGTDEVFNPEILLPETRVVFVEIEGLEPLMQARYHNIPTKEMKKLEQEKQCEMSLYKLKDGRIYEPADHIHAATIQASTEFQISGKGKKTYKELIVQTLRIKPERIPHIIQKWEPDIRRAVINKKASIMATRALLPAWKLKFALMVNDARIELETLKQILEYAGRMKGIGTYRQKYGKFKVSRFDIQS